MTANMINIMISLLWRMYPLYEPFYQHFMDRNPLGKTVSETRFFVLAHHQIILLR